MSKEEKKKLFKEFENDKEASFIYYALLGWCIQLLRLYLI